MSDKTISLARKLKALADQGIGGEKLNASIMLEKLMQQHGITIEMIEGKIVKEHEFYLEPANSQFFIQVASSVLGMKFNYGRYTYKNSRKPGKDRRYVTCTDSEFIEIMAKYDFYKSAYDDDLGIFYAAFIQKNRLFSKEPISENEDEVFPELSIEEKTRLFKMFQMMEGMEAKKFYKQIDK